MVRFYNKRGTAEQWIKESKQAVALTRLTCHRFRANEVRLWLSLIAYNLGNLWRRLALPARIGNWSLTSLQQRLVKTGGRLIKHARYYISRPSACGSTCLPHHNSVRMAVAWVSGKGGKLGLLLFWLAWQLALPLTAQKVVSARAGLITYLQGPAFVDGKPVVLKTARFPQMRDGETLSTGRGRAELLLAPGVVLRLAENSQVRMDDTQCPTPASRSSRAML